MSRWNTSVVVLTALCGTLVTGCLGGPGGATRESGAPGLSGLGDPAPSYGAWMRHTRGAIGEDLFPSPLPDGRILFSSNRYGPFYKLCLKPRTGSVVRRITDGPGHDLHPSPSPSGERVAFVSMRGGGPRLYLLDGLEGAPPKRLGDSDVDAVHPTWSPDGRRIAYSRLSPVTGDWEIWILDLETSQQSYVTDGLFPEFHPNGRRLAFQRARRRDENWFSIWTIETDGTREREIISGKDWGAVNPTWSPTGEWIAFNTVARSPENRAMFAQGDNLWCVRANGEHSTRLTSRPTPEWNPTWGPDGRIFFAAVRSGETAIWSLQPTLP